MHSFGFVQGDESTLQEAQVLFLQWYCETIDDAAEDLKQLSDPVVPLRLVDEAEEHVANSFAYETAVVHEFPIDSVQNGFEVVSFSRIFRVEELYKLVAEPLQALTSRVLHPQDCS